MKVSFRAARINANLKMQEAAEMLEIATSTLCEYEAGRYEPRFSTVQKMAEIYGCTLDDFKLDEVEN